MHKRVDWRSKSEDKFVRGHYRNKWTFFFFKTDACQRALRKDRFLVFMIWCDVEPFQLPRQRLHPCISTHTIYSTAPALYPSRPPLHFNLLIQLSWNWHRLLLNSVQFERKADTTPILISIHYFYSYRARVCLPLYIFRTSGSYDGTSSWPPQRSRTKVSPLLQFCFCETSRATIIIKGKIWHVRLLRHWHQIKKVWH